LINPKMAFVSAGFILLMLTAGVWACLHLPADARVAIHFGPDGAPDGWSTPFPAFFVMPGLGVLLWLFTLVMPRLAGSVYGVLWMLPVLILVPADLIILSPVLGLSWSSARVLPAMLGTIFILLGNVMGKLPPNPFIGVRTPWTLADDWVWDRTHRFAGWIMVAGGFILLGSALLLPPGLSLRHLLLLVVLTAAALSTVKSRLLSRQRRR
jgi:uncharacterized membrane protein